MQANEHALASTVGYQLEFYESCRRVERETYAHGVKMEAEMHD